jgi:hypothetical protein
MKLHRAIALSFLIFGTSAALADDFLAPVALPTDIRIADANFPSIGKWLLDHDEAVAHWLGEIVKGRTIDTPSATPPARMRVSGRNFRAPARRRSRTRPTC